MTMEEAEEAASHEPLLSAAQKPAEDALHFCEELIRDFRTRADRHKRIFKLLRYLSITLAIAVTVVSTLTVTQRMPLWIVPLISALSALCTTLLSTTNSQERWVHSRGVQQQFEAERFLYLQRAGSYATADEAANVRLFSERLVTIWSQGQQGWAQSVRRAAQELPSNT